MEIKKLKRRLTAAYHYSFIRMTLNFYTCYEMMAEKTGEPESGVLALYARYLEILSSFLEKQDMTLEGLESLRQDTIKEMEKLTAYTDIFQAYEYVMNRVEGRFMPQLVGKKPEDMETFMDEVIQYLAGTSDPADFHERFQLIISQLPVRFTKNKFFALVEEGMSVYKGAPEAGLEDMIYVLRSEALLNRPLASDGDCKTGEGHYQKLYHMLEEFLQTDFHTLQAAEYYHLSSELEKAGEMISIESGDILMLMDLINDLYVLLLGEGQVIMDLEETQVMTKILKDVLTLFKEDKWREIPEETADLLPKLEGKQESSFDQWMANEISMEELAKENTPEAEKLWKMELLLSGSSFASLERKASEKTVDEARIRKELDQLFADIRDSWKDLPKVLTRAAMAKCLSNLPITFKSSDEAESYIRNSLDSCSDEVEKEGCIRLIRSIME